MANNRIDELLSSRGESVRDFARRCGVPEQTLYKITKKTTMKYISIDVFLKIAHGLGMTAEELYYGTEHVRPQQPSITPNEQVIVDAYRLADEKQQRIKLAHARIEIEMAEMDALEKKDGIQAG